jgi:hypothetical protein
LASPDASSARRIVLAVDPVHPLDTKARGDCRDTHDQRLQELMPSSGPEANRLDEDPGQPGVGTHVFHISRHDDLRTAPACARNSSDGFLPTTGCSLRTSGSTSRMKKTAASWFERYAMLPVKITVGGFRK